MLGTLNTTGSSLVRVKVEPSTHSLKAGDNTTGSDHGPTNDLRDENFVTGLMGVSSTDGTTPTSIYVDASGNLLIDSS